MGADPTLQEPAFTGYQNFGAPNPPHVIRAGWPYGEGTSNAGGGGHISDDSLPYNDSGRFFYSPRSEEEEDAHHIPHRASFAGYGQQDRTLLYTIREENAAFMKNREV